MRVAILHDYLNQFGGAERVLLALLELFPSADLYTLLYDNKKTFGLFRKNLKKTSILDKPFIRNHHRAFIPLMPLAAGAMAVNNDYDLIISSTAGYAKGFGLRHRPGISHRLPYHISYCHSPLRYAWEIDYLKNLAFAPWPIKEVIVRPIAGLLRGWDAESSRSVNVFLANSKYIADKISSYYCREAQVVYPPVDTSVFYHEKTVKPADFFLMAGRLLYYKGFDLGIRAFNQLGLSLKIVGSGPEFQKLQSLAKSPNIEFVRNVSDERLRRLYNEARALIFPQIEDFGLVAAEAQSCGLPVLAYAKGGASEIVTPGKTGLLFEEQSPESIIRAVKDFDRMKFNRDAISRSAARFSKERFKNEFLKIIYQSGLKFS